MRAFLKEGSATITFFAAVFLQLVLDSQKRVFSWGFGGYGRLGHTEQKDEMVPRLVKLFDFPGRGATHIYTGYQCSFAVSEMGKKQTHFQNFTAQALKLTII